MPSIGWQIGKEFYTYDEAERIARSEGFFHNFPLAYLRAARETRVDGDWLSPSAAGGCPRQRILRNLHPYSQSLDGSWTSGVGTAIHGWLERGVRDSDSHSQELDLSTTIRVTLRDGTLVPFEVRGTVDFYDTDRRIGIDYKTVSDFDYWHRGKREWVQRELPSESHLIQANLYKYLLESNGYPVDEYWLWYVRTNKDAERRPYRVDLWENEDIYHIAGEIAEPLAWYVHTGELPQNRYDSKLSVCKMCPLKTVCRELAKEGT